MPTSNGFQMDFGAVALHPSLALQPLLPKTRNLAHFETESRSKLPAMLAGIHYPSLAFRLGDFTCLIGNLTKFIRDQLRVRNDVRDFDRYELRQYSISRSHPCGKRRPNVSYRRHMYEAEPIVDARLTFFRKRSIYYSGWSMADWWDEKLRAKEKELKEKQKRRGDDEDKRVIIGNTQQERLLAAAMREISFKEVVPTWKPKLRVKQSKSPRDVPVLTENCLSERNIGHLNMTPAKFQPPASKAELHKKKPKAEERPKPYLPIILHWKKMDSSTGYPQLKVSASMAKCGYYTG